MLDVAIFIDNSQVEEVIEEGDVGSGNKRFETMANKVKESGGKIFVVTNCEDEKGRVVVAEISNIEKIYKADKTPIEWKFRVKGKLKEINQKSFNEMFKEEKDCRFPCYVTLKDGVPNESPNS